MNQFRARAEREGLSKSLFVVLKRELSDMQVTKENEIATFTACEGDTAKINDFQKNSGLTKDICERILNEIKDDLGVCNCDGHTEPNAVDGERDLKTLYRAESRVPMIWTAKDGQKPVDLIVVGAESETILMGDCKFGLKRDDPWMIRKVDQFENEFAKKFLSVGACIARNDAVSAQQEMLLIVTSAMAPLLQHRIEDFKLDPECAGIPYDKIRVCSAKDIYSACRELLPRFAEAEPGNA